ncbi:MAG: hypothetical protein M3O68_08200 [Thermoproteota archaeon]|nr:hypothetical protein [Thermoproteota archaeon]
MLEKGATLKDPNTIIIEHTDTQKYKIGGERTGTFLLKRVHEGEGSDVAQQVFYFTHNGDGYSVSFTDSTLTFDLPETQNILNRIIHSFKFLS